MSPITAHGDLSRDFQSELPLHPAAGELLANFFDIGWPDPTKIHQQSAHLRNMLGAAREVIASHLGVAVAQLEFVGELGFGFQTALGGLLHDSESTFIHSQIDRQIVHAFARKHSAAGGEVIKLQPDHNGIVDFSSKPRTSKAVLSWQGTNRESGAIQTPPLIDDGTTLFADMTASFPLDRLPENWDSALWDPRSFRGPQGIAIVAISQRGNWRNPSPQIDNRRVFGSFSKPLLLATAVALENWMKNCEEEFAKLKTLNNFARQTLREKIPGLQIAGEFALSDPRYVAFVLPDSIAEEVLRKMEALGFLIDAGSACSAGALSPSHVLTAMGFAPDGNIRITLKPEQNEASIKELVEGIAASA